MAKAGFVHCPSENEPDVACCFYCLRELEGWEPEDNPWWAAAAHLWPLFFWAHCLFLYADVNLRLKLLTLVFIDCPYIKVWTCQALPQLCLSSYEKDIWQAHSHWVLSAGTGAASHLHCKCECFRGVLFIVCMKNNKYIYIYIYILVLMYVSMCLTDFLLRGRWVTGR